MKYKWLATVAIVALLLLMIVGVVAQDTIIETAGISSSGVEISWPQPVSEVWAVIPVIGTVNVVDLSYYFVEAVPLNEDLTIPRNALWLPVSPAFSEPVVNDVLANLDSSDAPDGLYALRLSVYTEDGQKYTDIVSPIRLNNARYRTEVEELLRQWGIEPTPSPEPTPTPEPVDNTPRVVVVPGYDSANMRRCDLVDNERCPVLGILPAGEEASVLGLSANGTGWFWVQRATGNAGWVSPTVVTPIGDFTNVPYVSPPPPLEPATPAPTSNLVITNVTVQGGNVICNQPFNAQVNLANTGNAPTNAGTVTVQDIHRNSGTITATAYGNYPSIAPGGSFVVVVPMTVSAYYNEDHVLRAIAEGYEFDYNYGLQQGNCGVSANPTPVPQPPTTKYFSPGQCTVDAMPNAPLYNAPNGAQVGQVGPAGWTTDAVAVTRVNGQLWFQLPGEAGNPGMWIPNSSAPYRQDACQI